MKELSQEEINKLLESVYERIDCVYGKDTAKLNNVIAKIAAQAVVITLQEYDKLNG